MSSAVSPAPSRTCRVSARNRFRRRPWWAALASCGFYLACAHPAPSPDAPTKGAQAPLEALEGDWALLGTQSLLRIANGGAVTFLLDDRQMIARNFRMKGRRGLMVDFEAEEDVHNRSCQLPFTRQARFLALSDEVGVFTDPGRRPCLAFRAGPVPSSLQGRYQLAHPSDGVGGLEVGARALQRLSTGSKAESPLAILAVGEHVDGAGTLLLLDGSTRRPLGLFATSGDNRVVELDDSRGHESAVDVRFFPAHVPAQGASSVGMLPASGSYRIEGLGIEKLTGSLQIDGDVWTFTTSAPSGEKSSFAAKATLAGRVGARLLHLHLVAGSEATHLDLRPIDGYDGAYVLSTGKDHGSVGFMFRADAVPAWAPSSGMDKDVALLCAELAVLSLAAPARAVEQALERTGAGAASDDMRSLCKSLLDVDPSMRLTLVKYAFASFGRVAPTCAGLDRLRDSKREAP
jgi:hypothetical protein